MAFKFNLQQNRKLISAYFHIVLVVALVASVAANSFAASSEPRLIGLRIENPEDMAPNKDEMIARVWPDVNIFVTMFGANMDQLSEVLFSSRPDCDEMPGQDPIFRFVAQIPEFATVKTKFPAPNVDELYYVCFRSKFARNRSLTSHAVVMTTASTPEVEDAGGDSPETDSGERHEHADFVNQGSENRHIFVVVKAADEIEMPMALQLVLIAVLLCFSGLFSGLNLGLMSLDQTELRIFMKTGTRAERKYAKIIYPLRIKGNFLLCSILYSNVIVNSGISILFDDLSPGIAALCFASLGIVIMGEIVPQSLCSRYGLAIGAKTIWITKFFMLITMPLSWPTSVILDKVLGKEVGHYYNRERLLELIRLNTSLQQELNNCQEVAIVTGALELANKTVKDVMTPLRDAFMIPEDARLDTKTISALKRSGYTRIPVYSGARENVTMLLHMKDMALVNPVEKIPLKTVCQFYQRPVKFVPELTPLNEMLQQFQQGHYHMAFACRGADRKESQGKSNSVCGRDAIGLLTLEDVIEEIIQGDILDETDVAEGHNAPNTNRDRQKTEFAFARDLSTFSDDDTIELYEDGVTPQLAIAAYQFLSTSVEAFNRKYISEAVLQHVIKQSLFRVSFQNKFPYDYEARAPEKGEKPKFIYTRDKPTQKFVMILEGRAEVTSGTEEMQFEAGPFFVFGKQYFKGIADRFGARFAATPTTKRARSKSAVITLEVPEQEDRKSTKLKEQHSTGDNHSESLPPQEEIPEFSPDFTVKLVKPQDLVYFQLYAPSYLRALKATLDQFQNGGQPPSQADLQEIIQIPGKKTIPPDLLLSAGGQLPVKQKHSFAATPASSTIAAIRKLSTSKAARESSGEAKSESQPATSEMPEFQGPDSSNSETGPFLRPVSRSERSSGTGDPKPQSRSGSRVSFRKEDLFDV